MKLIKLRGGKMSALQHPMFVHLPLAVVILLPALLLYAFYRERKGERAPQIWYIIGGLMIMASAAATLALVTGGMGEEIVEKAVSKPVVEEHEKWGELFALFIYITTFLSIAHIFVKGLAQKIVRINLFVLSFLLLAAGAQAGRLGGELVYKHNAASVLMKHYGGAESVKISKNSKYKTGKHDSDHHDEKRHNDRDHDEGYNNRERDDD